MPDTQTKNVGYGPEDDESLTWAEREFITLNLGDKRLNKRLKKITTAFMKKPNANIPQATGSWAEAKAAYRFFSNTKVTSDKIIASHSEATRNRLGDKKIILAPQDTSTVNYTSHPATQGLGPAGNLNDRGFLLHPTLAVSTEGTPLGLIDLQIWAREYTEEEIAEMKSKGKKERKKEKDKVRRQKNIEEKESFKWIESFRKTCEFRKELNDVIIVNVCDREGDFYDLFAEALSGDEAGKTELLVRAAHDRKVAGEDRYLWETMEALPVQGHSVIQIPRKKDRPAREAKLAIRSGPITVFPPKNRPKSEGLRPLQFWAVYADEAECPAGLEKVSWMLLTTMPVNGFEDAAEKVEWYTHRWVIELFFRVLKSGCEIEERQLEQAYRLKSCIAVDCVVAWKILFVMLIGREIPDLPASVIFEEYEWKAVYCFIHSTPNPPAEEPRLQSVVRQIAHLGGFLGRKQDGEPGMITLWRGMWRMIDITATYKIFNSSPP